MDFTLCYNKLLELTMAIKSYGGRRDTMKKGIHPNYHVVNVVCTTCGNEFESGSVKKELRVDTCSNCHPFYTGTQSFTQAAGRVERFKQRYGLKETK